MSVKLEAKYRFLRQFSEDLLNMNDVKGVELSLVVYQDKKAICSSLGRARTVRKLPSTRLSVRVMPDAQGLPTAREER